MLPMGSVSRGMSSEPATAGPTSLGPERERPHGAWLHASGRSAAPSHLATGSNPALLAYHGGVSRLGRGLLGILSLTPIGAILGSSFYVAIRLVWHGIDTHGRPSIAKMLDPAVFSSAEWLLLAVTVLGIVALEMVLAVVFAVLLAKRRDVGSTAKALFIAASLLVGYLVLPVIWGVYLAAPGRERD